MKQISCLLFILCFSVLLQAQTATNVVARQAGNTIVVSYDLDKTAIVTLLLSRDGGDRYNEMPQSVSGDIGVVNAGAGKKIVWDLLADAEDWEIARARFKVDTQGASELTFTIGDVQFTMVQVEGGESRSMPVKEFHIGKVEVTQALWRAVMTENPSTFKSDGSPVENVSWYDCNEFIRLLNRAYGSQLGGKQFALPTEREWEYAACGGNQASPLAKRFSGSDIAGAVAWFVGNSRNSTHKTGSKSANELGLYDMSGNVAEWCGREGEVCAVRGGSWSDTEANCQTSSHRSCPPDQRVNTVGFRLVLVNK